MSFGNVMGRVAIVTGGAGGLGRGVTHVLREAGAEVVVIDASRHVLDTMRQETAHSHLDKQLMIAANLTDEPDVQRAVQEVIDAYGRIEILCNLVGGYAGGTNAADTAVSVWQAQLDGNLTTAFLMSRAVIPVMTTGGYGRIINISSRTARALPAGYSAYAVSKAAVLSLTEVLAEETRADGITVNALLPSVIDTPGNRHAQGEANADNWVKPEEIGRVIRFLSSPDAAIISGAAIPVYGQA